jgi:hypothetical protein
MGVACVPSVVEMTMRDPGADNGDLSRIERGVNQSCFQEHSRRLTYTPGSPGLQLHAKGGKLDSATGNFENGLTRSLTLVDCFQTTNLKNMYLGTPL